PTCSTTSTVGLLPTCNVMPVCTNVRNPGNAASRRYGPNGRLGKTYDPVSFVTVVRATLVSVCVTFTSTPGKTAPFISFTDPLIVAVLCAQPVAEIMVDTNRPMTTTITIRFIYPPTISYSWSGVI